jgi:hypothetical protein
VPRNFDKTRATLEQIYNSSRRVQRGLEFGTGGLDLVGQKTSSGSLSQRHYSHQSELNDLRIVLAQGEKFWDRVLLVGGEYFFRYVRAHRETP